MFVEVCFEVLHPFNCDILPPFALPHMPAYFTARNDHPSGHRASILPQVAGKVEGMLTRDCLASAKPSIGCRVES